MRNDPRDTVTVARDVDPDVQTAGSKFGASKDTKGFRSCVFAVQTGTLGTSATIDFRAQSSPDNSTWTDITGSSITQMTEAGGDSDSVAKLVVNCEENARYLRGVLVVGTATSDAGSVAVLMNPKEVPVV